MKAIYKTYLRTTTDHQIRVSIYYERGKYTVSVQPLDNKKVEESVTIESYDPMLGMRDTIHTVGRRSSKQDAIAIENYENNIDKYK